jgi:hypothetical protein
VFVTSSNAVNSGQSGTAGLSGSQSMTFWTLSRVADPHAESSFAAPTAKEREDECMGWFGNNDSLKKQDWPTSRAVKVENGKIGGGTTVETHVRNDGRYIIEKNKLGDVMSAKKA